MSDDMEHRRPEGGDLPSERERRIIEARRLVRKIRLHNWGENLEDYSFPAEIADAIEAWEIEVFTSEDFAEWRRKAQERAEAEESASNQRPTERSRQLVAEWRRRLNGQGPRIPRNQRLDPKRESGRRIRPESLTMKHLGREFPGLGRLVEFRCTADGWVLIGTDASKTFPPDASIPYDGGHHHA